eukprot:snap_masked-scaffold_49-processed-gene-0.23-mRNA-1 protein AED:1.00 eAED:1.00 QI:0/0/0/0/1/1/2/0/93
MDLPSQSLILHMLDSEKLDKQIKQENIIIGFVVFIQVLAPRKEKDVTSSTQLLPLGCAYLRDESFSDIAEEKITSLSCSDQVVTKILRNLKFA